MRTLESAYALELARRRSQALRRAVDTYQTASLFVSTRDPRWLLMHMNDVALQLAGAARPVAAAACVGAAARLALPGSRSPFL